MPRPHCCRRVAEAPLVRGFKPTGIPWRRLEVLVLGLDELEALRLADLQGLYQDAAAESMGISRTTFSRLIASARHKVAQALIVGKALHIEGGVVEVGSSSGHESNQGQGEEHEPIQEMSSGNEAVSEPWGGGGCKRRHGQGRCRGRRKGADS